MPNEDNSRRCLLIAWISSALIIPCLSAFGRPLQHWVFREAGETGVAVVIGLSLFVLGVAAIFWQANQGLEVEGRKLLLLVLVLVIMLITITVGLPRIEERLHFVTFGVFGFYSKRLFPAWLALLVVVVGSTGDELFQAWLPDRVGDWRDVGINIVAGVIGLGFAWRK